MADTIISALRPPKIGESFVVVGASGSGKTTQGLTLPRPTLFLFFDPNGPASVRGFDVDYINFMPENTGITKYTVKNTKAKEAARYTPNVLNRFVEWFNAAANNASLDKYRSVVLDTTTWLEAAVFEDTMYERGRWGAPPDKDDYAQVRDNMMKVLYPVAGLSTSRGKHLLINVHLKDKTDRGGAVIGQELLLVGLARQTVPTLTANAFALEYIRGKGPEFSDGAKYVAYTRPHSLLNLGRSSQKRRLLPYELDLTIHDWAHPERYGLGKLISDIEEGQYEEFAELDAEGAPVVGNGAR